MTASLEDRIEHALGRRPVSVASLEGGCVADVVRADFAGGETLVVKEGAGLALEGRMLTYLTDHSDLPVPEVICAEDSLIIMTYLEAGDPLIDAAQADAANHIAALHSISAERFGFEEDTVIGGAPQPNPWVTDWLTFFRDHRLLAMAAEAGRAGRLPAHVQGRVETLCAKLGDFIPAGGTPSLLHGDLWGGNVLCRGNKIAGFVDPALYFGDPEIELAFSTLFHTFGEAFFQRYQERRPLIPGFFEERRDLYNLYPLLVHVRLFGGSYVTSVEHTLSRFGC